MSKFLSTGVSNKNRGTSKWMVYNNGKSLLKLMIWGENHLFLETPKHVFCVFFFRMRFFPEPWVSKKWHEIFFLIRLGLKTSMSSEKSLGLHDEPCQTLA